jgi:endonuclease/exonuclease/phosphatase family metal-dependent hydrolase
VKLRALTWNLKHGRSVPPAGRSLLEEFTAALSGWAWDVALLQEVPPWWPALLAQRVDADQRFVLTSRNFGLPVRRAIARRWPDAIKSNGGGANAILVRSELGIVEHRTARICLWPERRRVHGVRLRDGAWVCNLHAGGTLDECRLAASIVLRWASGAPVVLGGDFNVRSLSLEGFEYGGGQGVDHVFASGLTAVGSAAVLDRGRLSDHAPVLVSLTPTAQPGS